MNVSAEAQLDSTWSHPRDGSTHDDPLLAALVIVAKLSGRSFSAESLSAGLPLEDNCLTPELFPRAAARAGLSSRVVKRALTRISDYVLPALLLMKQRQVCILVSVDVDAGMAKVIQPESGLGEKQLPLAELEAEYSGYAIFIQAQHQFDERAPEVLKLRARHWFWGTLSSSWRIYRDVLVASFLINLFALASPLFVMNVYDRVVPNNAVETLWVLAIGVSVVYAFDFLMRLLRGYFIDLAGKKADVLLSARIFEQVMGMKMNARPPSVGAFANNLREFESIRDFITSATITTLVDLPFIIFFLFVIWFIGGPVVLVPLIIIPVVVIYGWLIQVPLRKAVESSFRASAQKGATLIETLTGIETIKHLGAESAIQRKWEQLTAHIAQWGVRSRLISSSAVNVAVFFQQFAQVAVVITGVYLVTEGELSMGGLIASVMLTGRALGPMSQYANLAVRYFQAKTALHSLNDIMAMPVERPEGHSFVSRPSLAGGVEFDNVSFQYSGEENRALNSVSFVIRPGEHVAIIGRVGSGKTTIEKLMQGLFEPTEGAVRIDGTDMRQIDPADLRRNMGYVPQDIMLFFGSVKENILMGAPHADDADILRVADLSGTSEFVNRHPLGFDLQVGERGDNLSGGQRQSIAIARALVNDPPFLLMDEPTNSMDHTSEDRLKRNLVDYVKDKTMVLVTHRASLLQLVDRLIVLDGGRVMADGPKDQVLQSLREGALRGDQ
ncbi:type I secretion system permease/ATPase [Sedimenticola sp.]|uniref:type I secretion system permease/ATPase n=1 Tax=Sedimenticola sp. TaxID=1940285 RepID=UPI003D106093